MRYIITLIITIFTLFSFSQKVSTKYVDWKRKKILFKRNANYILIKKTYKDSLIFIEKKYPSKLNVKINFEKIPKDSSSTLFFNRNGYKTLLIERKFTDNGKIIFVSKFHSNGFVKFRSREINKLPDGKTIFYDDQGNKIKMEFFIKGRKDYENTYYPKTGKLKQKKHFFEGVIVQGNYLSYYESGAIKDSCEYYNGSIREKKYGWRENGKLLFIENYYGGYLHGKSFFYYNEGTVKKIINYEYSEFKKQICYSIQGDIIRCTETIKQAPQYPGGEENMNNHISRNIKYPAMAREAAISGKVYVEFFIDTDGEVVDVKVVRGIGSGCDQEAIRVIKSMPKWKPGLEDGIPVRVKFVISVNFSLK